MKFKVFTLRFDPASGAFDDRVVQDFQSEREILNVSDHFFTHDGHPTLALVLHYRDEENGRRIRENTRPGKDWRADLDEEQKRIYDVIRTWRGRRAKREGMPPYLILNNREVAELAVRRPETITGLREINGIGETKALRWGDELLALLKTLAGTEDVLEEKPEDAG